MYLIRKESEYAIKIVKLLSTFPENKILKLAEISNLEEIPVNFAAKILRNLSKKKIVNSFRGSYGGYNLKKKKVTYYQIIKVTQGNIQIIKQNKKQTNEVTENLLKIQDFCTEQLNSLKISRLG